MEMPKSTLEPLVEINSSQAFFEAEENLHPKHQSNAPNKHFDRFAFSGALKNFEFLEAETLAPQNLEEGKLTEADL